MNENVHGEIIKEEDVQIGKKEKIISLVVLGLILITFWSMMNLVLLTFIISFVFYKLQKNLQNKVLCRLHFKIPEALVLSVLYLLFISLLVFGGLILAPKIGAQFSELATILFNIDMDAIKQATGPRLENIVGRLDFNAYLERAAAMIALFVAKVGYFSLSLFLSIILSFIILLEKNRISEFGRNLANSKLSFMYEYFRYFGINFAQTFGKVMKVQVSIAFINSILSMVVLSILGFPGILGLGTMIFALGFIPVAGVVMSLIPLSAIAFGVGGLLKVLQVLIMILVLHGIESYILNPKLIDRKSVV